jgi:hypothetical protein
MNLLLIASRTKRWAPWNYARIALNFLFGLCFCLVSLIQFSEANSWALQNSPWVLPTILIALFTVLVVNHLPHRAPFFFQRGRKQPLRERRLWSLVRKAGRSWEIWGTGGGASMTSLTRACLPSQRRDGI